MSKWSSQEISKKLIESGYDRDAVTLIISDRLSGLGKYIEDFGISKFENIITKNETEE